MKSYFYKFVHKPTKSYIGKIYLDTIRLNSHGTRYDNISQVTEKLKSGKIKTVSQLYSSEEIPFRIEDIEVVSYKVEEIDRKNI